MQFSIDKQTLEDLNILGRYKPDSVFNIYNKTTTRGGSLLLEQLFREPFTDGADITERSSIFQFFRDKGYILPFSANSFEQMEQYVESADSSSLIGSLTHNLKRKFLGMLAGSAELQQLLVGQKETIELITLLKEFTRALTDDSATHSFKQESREILSLLEKKELASLSKYKTTKESFTKFLKYDYTLRVKAASILKSIISKIYTLDVYTTVARVSTERNYSFASISPVEEYTTSIEGLYHPCIPGAIPNDLHFSKEQNVLFLTGANMAGKSTLMKSFGIAVYLSHMGFPGAFSSMKISPAEGLFTSINVPDNLNLGYSHFYAEVMRVKMIAQEVAKDKRLIIMFDELFKGTNVKDAYDATVEITSSFAKRSKCSFIVSTHIMEAGETLKKNHKNITFKLLPSNLRNNIPRYTYILEDGISDDRHGMTIIKNEKILEIIQN
jgi:DNA mismatch repair ATPase MutS